MTDFETVLLCFMGVATVGLFLFYCHRAFM